MQARNVREGTVAGLLGAGAVALWFLVLDLVAGSALATPEFLGRSLFSVLGKGIDWPPMRYVLAYTVVHVAVFVAIGVLVAAILEASKRTPGVLAGLLLLFVVFEAAFYGFTLFLAEGSPLGRFAWYQVGGANLLAAALMGRYLWRADPEVAERMERVLAGRL